MQDSQLDVLKGAQYCLQQGERLSLVSVAKTWGTSPRPIGSLLAVSSSGKFFGSVSGGCVEEDLIQRLKNTPAEQTDVMLYGETEQERHRLGLPCGGVLKLVVEPFNDPQHIDYLIEQIEQRKTVVRTSELAGNTVAIKAWGNELAELSDTHWQNIFGPTWRLIIIGAGETGRFLAEFAQGLGFDIVVCDPRDDYQNNWPLTQLPVIATPPDELIDELRVDERTAIVAVAHDPRVDDMALLTALKSKAFYIGALGSKLNNQKRRERLQQHLGFSEQEVARLHGPVGFDIASKNPAEIAISILAEVIASKNGLDTLKRNTASTRGTTKAPIST